MRYYTLAGLRDKVYLRTIRTDLVAFSKFLRLFHPTIYGV